MSFYDPYKRIAEDRKRLDEYEKRIIEWHRHIITRMRDDPALLEKAKGEWEKQRALHASDRRLAKHFGERDEIWGTLLQSGDMDAIERFACADSKWGEGLRAISPLKWVLDRHEKTIWEFEHFAEIQPDYVYENKDGEQRLVVSVRGDKNPVVTWQTADPNLPAGAKAQGSATVASFRRWATKVRPATKDDWGAFSRVEYWRKWHAAFHRQYRRKHQTASGY